MGHTVQRTNSEVARAMLVTGAVLIAVAILLTFFDNRFANFYVNSGARFIAEFVMHLWSILVQLGYPLGSFLIVGSIIVNRLPERPAA